MHIEHKVNYARRYISFGKKKKKKYFVFGEIDKLREKIEVNFLAWGKLRGVIIYKSFQNKKEADPGAVFFASQRSLRNDFREEKDSGQFASCVFCEHRQKKKVGWQFSFSFPFDALTY